MARLSARKRNALPDSAFAGPDRSFPIDTPGRARNAIGRATQFHPELKAKIRAKVHRKFPGIKQHDAGARPKMHGGAVKNRADRSPRH